MSELNPQQSEAHESTADAGTSPTADGDEQTTRQTPGTPSPQSPKLQPEPPTPGTRIVRDETDVGGPLVIESDDPDLNPPKAPVDPFPTLGTPEVDP
jgi:hypothetical protein